MKLEEARDILANCIDDYVISSYCNNTCDEEVDCKNEDCIFHQAIEVVLNHITKQEKMIELMARFIDTELSSEHLSKVLKIDVKPLETYREDIKQYFEKKAEDLIE